MGSSSIQLGRSADRGTGPYGPSQLSWAVSSYSCTRGRAVKQQKRYCPWPCPYKALGRQVGRPAQIGSRGAGRAAISGRRAICPLPLVSRRLYDSLYVFVQHFSRKNV